MTTTITTADSGRSSLRVGDVKPRGRARTGRPLPAGGDGTEDRHPSRMLVAKAGVRFVAGGSPLRLLRRA